LLTDVATQGTGQIVVWVSIGNAVFYVKKIVTIKARVCKTGIYLKRLEINNNQMNVIAGMK